MAGDTFNIGLSALIASQRGLATTGHNIANVNTQGYSRQLVNFEARTPQFIGIGYAGKGVEVRAISRMANQFLTDQVRIATANQAQADKTVDLVSQIDNQLGAGLIPESMQGFFNAVADANNNPGEMANRQVVIETARATLSRFSEQEVQLNNLAVNVNDQIRGTIGQINGLTQGIAKLNNDIAVGAGLASGEPPNDLLDKRDQMLVELAKLVGVQTQDRGDGMVNVLIGDGQLVVTGNKSENLQGTANTLDASRVEVSFKIAGNVTTITPAITGGSLGALVTFRDSTLDPARGAIGRLEAGFAMAANAQHRMGMDMNGALGGDLFTVPAPVVNSSTTNVGTVNVAFDAANYTQLSASDYRLSYDGTNFNLDRLADGTFTTLSGAGPFNIDGLTITIGTPPAAGDSYLLQPTKTVPRAMALATGDPTRLALAGPVQTARATANISAATISRGQVLDPTNPALLNTTQLVFANPPTAFQVNGAGPLVPFTSGADIDINGWRVQVTGAPAAGDTFTIKSNVGGIGDNGNGLALAGLQSKQVMLGNTATFSGTYGLLMSQIGATAEQANISSKALGSLAENATTARDSLAGVNLEEEAANLMRFQQAFQAAAQIIKAADTAFQALIAASRGS